MIFHVLAQAGGGGVSIPWDRILTAGVTPVIVFVLLLTGQLYIGRSVDKQREAETALWQKTLDAAVDRADRAEKRAEASEERERRLRDVAEEKFLPVLNSTSHTLERVLDFLMGRKAP